MVMAHVKKATGRLILLSTIFFLVTSSAGADVIITPGAITADGTKTVIATVRGAVTTVKVKLVKADIDKAVEDSDPPTTAQMEVAKAVEAKMVAKGLTVNPMAGAFDLTLRLNVDGATRVELQGGTTGERDQVFLPPPDTSSLPTDAKADGRFSFMGLPTGGAVGAAATLASYAVSLSFAGVSASSSFDASVFTSSDSAVNEAIILDRTYADLVSVPTSLVTFTLDASSSSILFALNVPVPSGGVTAEMQVTDSGLNPGLQLGYTLASVPVPEPSSSLLVLMGLAGWRLVRRR